MDKRKTSSSRNLKKALASGTQAVLVRDCRTFPCLGLHEAHGMHVTAV